MSDQPSAPKAIARDFRTGIAIATLGLQYTGIGLLLWLGEPGNTIHTSGLTALFWSAMAVLAGVGVSGIAPRALQAMQAGAAGK